MLAAQIEGYRKHERSRPPVHRIEGERLLVANNVRYQPDDEPDQSHGRSFRIVASELG